MGVDRHRGSDLLHHPFAVSSAGRLNLNNAPLVLTEHTYLALLTDSGSVRVRVMITLYEDTAATAPTDANEGLVTGGFSWDADAGDLLMGASRRMTDRGHAGRSSEPQPQPRR